MTTLKPAIDDMELHNASAVERLYWDAAEGDRSLWGRHHYTKPLRIYEVLIPLETVRESLGSADVEKHRRFLELMVGRTRTRVAAAGSPEKRHYRASVVVGDFDDIGHMWRVVDVYPIGRIRHVNITSAVTQNTISRCIGSAFREAVYAANGGAALRGTGSSKMHAPADH